MQTTVEVSTRLINGIATTKPVVGCDWSRKNGIDTWDGKTARHFATLAEVAVFYTGYFLVLEAPSESFQLQNRQIVLDAFAANNIDAYCYKSQFTAKFRKGAKSDKKDAKTIYRIATEIKLSLHRFGPLCETDPIRDRINERMIEDRYLYDGETTLDLCNQYIGHIPSGRERKKNLESLGDKREFLISGTGYRAQIGRILLVAEEVRKDNRGFREFRRQLGNYGNAYGSMPRSEFYYWWTRAITNSRLTKQLGKKVKTDDLTTAQKKLKTEINRQVLKEADKIAKFLWHLTS